MLQPPEFASWESTLVCDLRCSHCGLAAGNPRGRELDFRESLALIKDLAEFGVKNFVISGGEFTLRDKWENTLEFALSKFEYVRVITNGTRGRGFIPMLEKLDGAEKLVVSVSLDGMRDTHDRRRGRWSFSKVFEVLSTPSQIPKTAITTVAKDNFGDLENVFRLCLEKGVALWSVQLALPKGRMSGGEVLSRREIDALADFIYECQTKSGSMEVMADDCFAYTHPMRRKYPWQGCPAGKKLISIFADGSVSGCPTMIYSICGKWKRGSLAKIWEGRGMGKVREPLSGCRGCDLCAGGCKTVNRLFSRQFCSNRKGERLCQLY